MSDLINKNNIDHNQFNNVPEPLCDLFALRSRRNYKLHLAISHSFRSYSISSCMSSI